MPRRVGQAHTLAPMPFVGINAGVEITGEYARKAGPQPIKTGRIEHVLDHQKPVLLKASDLFVTQSQRIGFDHLFCFYSFNECITRIDHDLMNEQPNRIR